jgi:sugar phosphate isomerase/epimerase
MRPAVRLACFGLPFRKALIRAAELGAEAVEIDARRELQLGEMSQTAIRQISKLLDDQGLRISALSFNTRRGYNVMADLDRRVAATQ